MIWFFCLVTITPWAKGASTGETFRDVDESIPSKNQRTSPYMTQNRRHDLDSDNWNSIYSDDNEMKRGLIIGGSLADSEEYRSYAVTDLTINSGGLCGATLIHPDILVSAAHCGLSGIFENGVLMNIGATSIFGDDAIDRIEIVEQLINPNFDSNTLNNDIMLIKLASPSSAPPSTWNNITSIPVNNEALTIIGFGRTESGTISESLREATVYVVDTDVCSEAYAVATSSTINGDYVLCAGSDQSATCSGDSGGPLFRSGLLVGVTSFGIVNESDQSCATTIYLPNGFTRVSAMSDFISNGICTLSANPPASCFASAVVSDKVPTVPPISTPPPQSPVTVSPTKIPRRFSITFTPFTVNPTTERPSSSPSKVASLSPSTYPTSLPSYLSDSPSVTPTNIPTLAASAFPSIEPSINPTTNQETVPADGDRSPPTIQPSNAYAVILNSSAVSGDDRSYNISLESDGNQIGYNSFILCIGILYGIVISLNVFYC
jgi:trypsin